MIWADYIPKAIADLYEIHDYKHAAAILSNEFPEEFREICEALDKFRFTEEEIKSPGGNESSIPKKFSQILRPHGWKEDTLTAKMIVDEREISTDVLF